MCAKIEKKSFSIQTINRNDLTLECWHIQVWGLPYCRTCKYLGTEECGGYRIRRNIISGNFPLNGLPEAQD